MRFGDVLVAVVYVDDPLDIGGYLDDLQVSTITTGYVAAKFLHDLHQ
jgi:hypothetical protein